MKMILCFLIFIVYSFGSDVIDLNPNNFKKLVQESDLPYIVEFFAPWCGHCKKLAPEWEKAATNLKGIVPLGKVDCTVHQTLCQQYDVKGYPTIKVFSERGKKVTDYQQARQANSIVRFATDLLPNNVVRIKDTTSLGNFLSQKAEIPHFLLFSTKSEVSPLIKSLSLSYKNRIIFGQVTQDVTEVVQKYNVQSYPKIFIIKSENEDPIPYEGSINPTELRDFVASYTGEPVDDTSQSSPPPPPPPRARPTTEVSYVELTEENIDTVCNRLCIIGFVDTEMIDDKKTIKTEQNDILQDILIKFKSDGKFSFGWIDKNTQSNILQKFSLSNDEPSLVVYNSKRQKFVKSESFDFKTCFRTIEHVLTGDAHYSPCN